MKFALLLGAVVLVVLLSVATADKDKVSKCRFDSDCAKNEKKRICKFGECIQCSFNSDCARFGKAACRDKKCLECVFDSDCKDKDKRRCTRENKCKQCKSNLDCKSRERCNDKHKCEKR